jgi:hypothetical protein
VRSLTKCTQYEMICYVSRMTLVDRFGLSSALLRAIVDAGEEGHRIAVAHDSEPGANPYIFGTERYHRSSEIMKPALEVHGLTVWMDGAGHRARSDDYELRFCTAKSVDVQDRRSFDFTTEAKIEAGTTNMASYLPGMDPETVPGRVIIHVVLSGDSERGLTAVHLGRLIAIGDRCVTWGDDLQRIDDLTAEQPRTVATETAPALSYDDQPEPLIPLELQPTAVEVNDGK